MSELLPDLSRIDRIGLDTETSGLKFKDRPVGVSWATPDGRSGYPCWGHECGDNNISVDEVRYWLETEVNRPGLTVYLHNAGFDLRMLAYRGTGNHGLPGLGVELNRCRVEDTGFMAALLDELQRDLSLDGLAQKHCDMRKRGTPLWEWLADTFGGKPTRKGQGKNIWRAPGSLVDEYARFDAIITLALADTLRPQLTEEGLDDVYELETSLIPLLLRMHLVGVKADVKKAKQLRKDMKQKLEQLQAKWQSEVGDVNYGSTKQLVPIFDKYEIPYNYTELGNPSITAEVLDESDHPICEMIKDMKKLTHYSGTFVENYVLNVVDENDIIHGEFHPLRNSRYGTVSGRFSSGGDLNLQNIPARDPYWAPLIRSMFIPCYEGGRWLQADLSQIEYRFLAHYSGGNLQRAYNDQPDIDFHQWCSDMTGLPRKQAKNVNFAIAYGAGVPKTASMLGTSLDEAKDILYQYHQRVPEARKLSRKTSRRAAARGYIITWGGRKRRFRKDESGKRYIKTHIALNALLQGSAADLIKRAMIAVAEIIDWETTPLALQVHDELDFTIPPGEEGLRFTKQVKEIMEDFNLLVPVMADCEVGDDWGHVKKVEL